LLVYASGGQHDRWQQLVGMPLTGRPIETSELGVLRIFRPDGRDAPVSSKSLPNGWEWSYADTDVAGVYGLRGLPQRRIQPFAVNVDTSEADLAKIDEKYLPQEFNVRRTWQHETNGHAIGALSQSAWNQQILWGVLALLFLESFMAWQFGRGAI
jgi:hypothetical protein